MDILERDTNTDNLVLLLNTRIGPAVPLQDRLDLLINIREKKLKPVLAIVPASFAPESVQQTSDIIQKLQEGGVPAFTSLERGAFALRKALDYYNLRKSISPGY